MLTTVIGAYPKPKYLKITDWFNAKGGTDTSNPTKLYKDELIKMGKNSEQIFDRATKARSLSSTLRIELSVETIP